MEKPTHHILVCASFRPNGEPKGKCHRKNSLDFLPYIENEIIDRGLENVIVSSTCCLKLCDEGTGNGDLSGESMVWQCDL